MRKGTTAAVVIGLLAATPVAGKEISGVPLSVGLQDVAASKGRALTITIKQSDGSTLKAAVTMSPHSTSYRHANEFVERIQLAIARNEVVTLNARVPDRTENGREDVYAIDGVAIVGGGAWWLGEDPIVNTGAKPMRTDPWTACRTGEKGVAWIKANCPTF